ncbi:MAG: triose-phosphate isomerase [Desulfurivibrionaceae bacterium]
MKRRPLIAGNWKMNTSLEEAEKLCKSIVKPGIPEDRDVMLAPPFTHLTTVAFCISGSPLLLAGQNVCWEESGAYTGEISPPMLKETGCRMAIVGHSERRQLFGEDNAMINKRLKGALAHGLIPILCVGETLEEREGGTTFKVLKKQIREGLREAEPASGEEIVLAYEPVWAIGTGRTATVEQAGEVHTFIRKLLAEIYEKNIADKIRILYGGSVKPDNINELMSFEEIDGALVGGASLKSETFNRIINFQY